MKKYFRIVSLFLAAALLFSLAACGKKPEEGATSPSDTTETAGPHFVEVSREGEVEKIPVETIKGKAANYTIAMDPEYFTFSSDGQYDTFTYEKWEGDTNVYYCVYPYQDTTAEELADGLLLMYGDKYNSSNKEQVKLGKYDAVEVAFSTPTDGRDAEMFFYLIETDYGCLVIESQIVFEMYEGLFAIMRACFNEITVADAKEKSADTEQQTAASPALEKLQKQIEADGEIFGVAYLGYYDCGLKDAVSSMKNEGFWNDFSFISDITADRCVLAEGAEWYAVVPASKNVNITVYEYYFDFEKDYIEGENPGKGREFVSVNEPVLLRGNISDIIPNFIVTAESKSGSIDYSPSLSLENGRLSTYSGGVCDLTPYESLGMSVVDPLPDAAFCGTWRCFEGNGNDGMYALTLTLNPDGTAEYKYGYVDSEPFESFSGTWVADDDIITLELYGGPVEFQDFYDTTIRFEWEIDSDPLIYDDGLIVRHIADSSPFIYGGEGAQYWMIAVRDN